ncbi:hypothetical protein A2225_02395 [Candidatus Nomurabacteria bacterium RIFOXYA2_FULL_42_12]|uniref:Uncharacterized protein n=1 Tax=Candidatus Nomurabacteria bacterium RIFOXYA2_FULL_42_12 TaxID=1801801 RepID=A0A1F6YMS8_9BACT|nr:MAG: hypothetical protein A2225_02395 [Candidatus Nomurabacteria bacterium RIFOXYA2_FULL_42_12]
MALPAFGGLGREARCQNLLRGRERNKIKNSIFTLVSVSTLTACPPKFCLAKFRWVEFFRITWIPAFAGMLDFAIARLRLRAKSALALYVLFPPDAKAPDEN